MTDESLRALLQRWSRFPDDQLLAEAALTACRRAGEPVSDDLWFSAQPSLRRLSTNRFGRQEYLHVSTGIMLIHVPPGQFMMGSALGHESPPHLVRLTQGYLIGKFEVTWEQFSAYCRMVQLAPPVPSFSTKGAEPVHNVSFKAATAFSLHFGLALPTEAQWEWAARGPDERTYVWGEDPPSSTVCNSFLAMQQRTAEVGSFARDVSPFGCFDMAANVSEFVSDRFGRYPSSPVDDPHGPAVAVDDHPGGDRVIRGGSYISRQFQLRAAFRTTIRANSLSPMVGFRVCMTRPAVQELNRADELGA